MHYPSDSFVCQFKWAPARCHVGMSYQKLNPQHVSTSSRYTPVLLQDKTKERCEEQASGDFQHAHESNLDQKEGRASHEIAASLKCASSALFWLYSGSNLDRRSSAAFNLAFVSSAPPHLGLRILAKPFSTNLILLTPLHVLVREYC